MPPLNKLQQAEARQRQLILRIARSANELREVNARIAKYRAGKLTMPPPPGVKVKIESGTVAAAEFDDLVPTFGSGTVWLVP